MGAKFFEVRGGRNLGQSEHGTQGPPLQKFFHDRVGHRDNRLLLLLKLLENLLQTWGRIARCRFVAKDVGEWGRGGEGALDQTKTLQRKKTKLAPALHVKGTLVVGHNASYGRRFLGEFYHSSKALAQVRPPPKATRRTLSPFWSFISGPASCRATGMQAADMFPYL